MKKTANKIRTSDNNKPDMERGEAYMLPDFFKPRKVEVYTTHHKTKYYYNYFPIYTHQEINSIKKTYNYKKDITIRIANDLNFLFSSQLARLYKNFYENGFNKRLSSTKNEKGMNDIHLVKDRSKISFFRDIYEVIYENQMDYKWENISLIERHLKKSITEELKYFARKEFSIFLNEKIKNLSGTKRGNKKYPDLYDMFKIENKEEILVEINRILVTQNYIENREIIKYFWLFTENGVKYDNSRRLVALSTIINEKVFKIKYNQSELYHAFNKYYHAGIKSPTIFKTCNLPDSEQFLPEFQFIKDLTK